MTQLIEVMLHGKVSLLKVLYGVDEREVVTEFFAQRIVAEEHGIVYGFLQWLNLLRIKIVAQIVAKRPHHSHIRVGVLQTKEVLTANPSVFIVVLTVKGINEERRTHPVDVVDMYVLILAHKQGSMANGTSSAEQIYEVGALGQEAHNALCQLVFASFVR